MAKGAFSKPRFQHEDGDEQQPQLRIPDLSLDFSDTDFLNGLSLTDPDLIDLNIGEDPASVPELSDPATLDLNFEELDVPVKLDPPQTDIAAVSAGEMTQDPIFPVNPTEPSAPEAGKKKLSGTGKVLILIAAVLLTFITAVGGYIGIRLATDPYENRILNNVTVAGVNIGGMTRKEAEAALHGATASTFSQQDMVVSLPHDTIILSPADTGAELNVRCAVRAAYIYGRWGSKAEQQAAYTASADTEYTVDVSKYLRLDEDFIREQLSAYASKYETTRTQYTYHLEGKMPMLEEENFDAAAPCQTLEITLGTPSLGLDMEEIYYSILTAYSRNQFQVSVEDIDPAARPDPVDLNALLETYHIAPVDAGLDMENYCPIPGVYGYTFNMEEAQKIVDAADYGETVSIPMEYVEPEIKQDEVYFRDVLGQCKTPHTGNENRNENLRIACSKINELILQPGEEFSYNDTLGPRTRENGYKPAPAYSGTVLVDSYGGGICQISSTLYYCTLLSDLEIVSRINHGFPVGYIDLGMDATVSWGNPDFKFKNNTNFPIRLEAWVENGYVNIRILGTIEKDYYVQMEYEIVGGADPSTTYQEYGPDEGYYDGQVISPGTVGHYVVTYRCKYDRETDDLISRDFEARSNYMSTDRIVVKIIE